MNVGMTGTRKGMTNVQRQKLEQLLVSMFIDHDESIFHHGDCIGADAEAHNIAERLGYTIWVHPPEKDEVRAFKKGEYIEGTKGYFARNRDIVDCSSILLATPVTNFETPKGGTWYTIRYAAKVGVKCIIIWPNGIMEVRE